MVGNVAIAGGQALGPDATHVPQVHLRWQEDVPAPAPGLRWRRGSPPQGLKNLGNTCYLNSVLQCLTYTPPLANYCLLSSHSSLCATVNPQDAQNQCPFCFLEKRIARSLTNDLSVDAPVKISNRLRLFATQFRSGRQEDAHEFLRCAIEACNNSCIQVMKKVLALAPVRIVAKQRDGGGVKEEPHTVVKEIFGGVLQSQVKCLSCEAESNKRDEIMDLSLDLGRLSSLKEALCSFFQPEVLDADNKYRCSNCKSLSAARKQMSVFKAPNVLVIQFKRFENFLGGKIDRHIQFDERLGLAGHMCKASKDARPEYSLYGVIVHSGGTQDSGHYYAYVKDVGGEWYCCDDSSVTTTSIQNVLSERAYVLFYARMNAGAKKVPAVARTCGAVLSSPPSVQDIRVAQSDNCMEQGMSLSSVKPKVSVNNGGDSVVSSVRKPQVELSGSDNVEARESSGKPLSPSMTDSQAEKGGGAIFQNGDRQSALNGSLSTEKDSMESSAVTNGTPHDCSSRSLANGLLDLAAVATSPSMNTSSSSSTQSLITGNPASACSRSSSGENKIKVDWIKQKRSVHANGCEALQTLTKRSRLDSNLQPQGPVSEVTGTLSSLTGVNKGSNGENERETTGLDGLKRRLEDEGRQNLIQSEWVEALRSNLRAAKKHRLAGQSCRTAEEKLRMRKQIVDDVQEKMIGTVPRALKERLVGDLQAFFRCQSG